ncbi:MULTISPECIES: DinB family protein [Streptomyces]|uniref:DinB family protein n=1 Tax=Streptomyces TaxID=1883 RepID=UPI001E42DF67|nr:DinB family protein [Streptomyces flavotricini]
MTDDCGECGFTYDLNLAPSVASLARDQAAQFADFLHGPHASAPRPAPGIWSPLEYACHVRDVLLVQRERVLVARRSNTPVAEPMGRDERVEHDGYALQDPAAVARQLTDAAALFANVLDRLPPDHWDRTLVYSYPEPAERTVRWLAVHTLHELRHHLHDAHRQAPKPHPGQTAEA